MLEETAPNVKYLDNEGEFIFLITIKGEIIRKVAKMVTLMFMIGKNTIMTFRQ
jgi:hypothetical protein